ncbi:MAG: DNA polymerase III subunit delta' [Candidatus Omnitrophica bacterium]|nr:DNA polymerase III subunit delta' [Candidatus Omnitrophota bacterium]
MAFSNIKGHDKVIERLKGFLRENRLAGAYLFAGPKGIGKALMALEFAKAINCEKGSPDPCDSCVSCVRIDKNAHPDVHIIDPQDPEIKIEYIRQLQKEINLKPYEARKKIFIIPAAEQLNSASASCLLKTLEEPAPNSVIILVTDKPASLLKTIISRCQIIKFSAILPGYLERLLNTDYRLEPQAAHFLAYFCEGRLGHALLWKDSDILVAKNAIIDSALSPKASSGDYALAIEKLSPVSGANSRNRLEQERGALRSYFNILASWFRDIYLLKAGIPSGGLINLDRKDELRRVAGKVKFSDIENALQQISSSLLCIEQNVNTRLLLTHLRWAIRST